MTTGRPPTMRAAILAALRETGKPMDTNEIARRADGVPYSRTLSRLVADGDAVLVRQGRGNIAAVYQATTAAEGE